MDQWSRTPQAPCGSGSDGDACSPHDDDGGGGQIPRRRDGGDLLRDGGDLLREAYYSRELVLLYLAGL